MRKIIKQWGNSLIIRLNPEEVEVNNIREGDIIDIIEFKIIRNIGEKK